jgi:hypothetical protein
MMATQITTTRKNYKPNQTTTDGVLSYSAADVITKCVGPPFSFQSHEALDSYTELFPVPEFRVHGIFDKQTGYQRSASWEMCLLA